MRPEARTTRLKFSHQPPEPGVRNIRRISRRLFIPGCTCCLAGKSFIQVRLQGRDISFPPATPGRALLRPRITGARARTEAPYCSHSHQPTITSRWSRSCAPADVHASPRPSHELALLHPGATIGHAGSNPKRGTYEPQMHIYQPAYLFKPDGSVGGRPTITQAPTPIDGPGSHTAQTPDAD